MAEKDLNFSDFNLELCDDLLYDNEDIGVDALSLSVTCAGTNSGTSLLCSFMTNVTEDCSTC